LTSNIDTRPFFTRAQTSPSLVAKFVARRMRWGGGLFDRCSADEDENLNCCATRSPRAAQRRAVAARGSVSGDPSTRDAVRLSRIDVTARVSTRPRVCTRAAADQIPFARIRESAPRNPLEADATDQQASCTAEVRPIPPRARPSGSLDDSRDGARPWFRRPDRLAVAVAVPSRVASRWRDPFRARKADDIVTSRADTSNPSLASPRRPTRNAKQMRSPRSWWTWGRTR
jgi:hypothetical protein